MRNLLCPLALVAAIAMLAPALRAQEEKFLEAIRQNDRLAVERLLAADATAEAKARVDTPLILAVRANFTAVVDFLLKAEASVETANTLGDTPFLVAVTTGRMPIVERLLARGANANAVNKAGDTPLILAARHEHAAIVRLLLSRVRDIGLDVRNKAGRTALDEANARKNEEIVTLLRGSASNN